MEIYAEISAAADSMELLEKLFGLIASDGITEAASYGTIRPTKKNRLKETWYGLRFRLEGVDPPYGFYMNFRSEGINWEICMKKYATLLGEHGCVFAEFTNSVSPDYCVLGITTEDGSCLIYDSDEKDISGKLKRHMSAIPKR